MTTPELYLRRETALVGSSQVLQRGALAGELMRLDTGVYMSTKDWTALDSDARYRARVSAAALRSSPGAQFSHYAAAALYRLPMAGAWPVRSHELVDRVSGGSSRRSIIRHGLGRDLAPMAIDGVTVTSFARTVLDIAATGSFLTAVVMVDDTLREPRAGSFRHQLSIPALTKPELRDLLEHLMPYPGFRTCELAIDFADGGSESPEESRARMQFHLLGYPRPELQHEVVDERGSAGFLDFFFPELDLGVEVDGYVKYGKDRVFQTELTPQQIFWAEKKREDRIRRTISRFARLTSELVRDRRALDAYLRPFGLHSARPRRAGSSREAVSDR